MIGAVVSIKGYAIRIADPLPVVTGGFHRRMDPAFLHRKLRKIRAYPYVQTGKENPATRRRTKEAVSIKMTDVRIFAITVHGGGFPVPAEHQKDRLREAR